MIVNTATKVIELTSETNYAPAWVNDSKLLDDAADASTAAAANANGHYSIGPIIKVLVLSNDYSGNIDIKCVDNVTAVTIPKSALLIGNVYDMHLSYFKATGIRLLAFVAKNMPPYLV